MKAYAAWLAAIALVAALDVAAAAAALWMLGGYTLTLPMTKGRSAMNYEWVFLGAVWFLGLLCIVTLGIALSDLMQI